MKMNPLIAAFAVLILISHFSLAQQPECDYGVDIITGGEESGKEGFKWKMKAVRLEGSPTNITGRARIESAGKLVKEYTPWNSDSISRQKTSSEYSPNLKEGEYTITAEIATECDDANKENNMDFKLVTIKPGIAVNVEIPIWNSTQTLKSNIETRPGGDAVSSEMEDAPSKEAALGGQANPDGAINSTCPTQENATQYISPIPTSNVAKGASYETAYESSSEKSKNLIIYMLLGTSILLNIILIWKR